jgi:hypothetical protein
MRASQSAQRLVRRTIIARTKEHFSTCGQSPATMRIGRYVAIVGDREFSQQEVEIQ